MRCVIQLLWIRQNALDLIPNSLKEVKFIPEELKPSLKLTLLKRTTPFSLGEMIPRSHSGMLCMHQTKTEENFAKVTVGMAMSTPSIRSP